MERAKNRDHYSVYVKGTSGSKKEETGIRFAPLRLHERQQRLMEGPLETEVNGEDSIILTSSSFNRIPDVTGSSLTFGKESTEIMKASPVTYRH